MDLPAPRRALALGLALAASLLAASPASAAFGDRTLRPGSKGADVKTLQRTMTKLAVPTPADGHFGSRTATSVRRYERAAHLRADAVVTPRQAAGMRRALARRKAKPEPAKPTEAPFGARPLKRGMRGNDVKALQLTLTKLGHPAGADGDFGAETDRQLRAYEAAAGVPVDGEVDAGQAAAMLRKAATAPKPAVPTSGPGTFPVRGPHTFGSTGSLFGAPRGGRAHQGQDVAAACGVAMVSAEAGRVMFAGYHSGAGNYIVIHGETSDRSLVYMHLQSPALLRTGARAARGQAFGAVGNTGHSFGCHLHFEIWTAPGWYKGGKPIDPLPALRAWDAAG